jgi:UDP-N-acetyl-D-glucosamine dehydrogenase
VIDAADSKPFGFMPFYPGPGIGGHCIPVVPLYIRWKLKTLDRTEHFIKVADQINDSMPNFVVEKIVQALALNKKSISNSKILILGVAFKANVNDSSYSPALPIMNILHENGAELAYHDPFVPVFHMKNISLQSTPLENNISKFDCCVLITHHSSFNIAEMVKQSKVFVDTRNATKNIQGYDKKIIKI